MSRILQPEVAIEHGEDLRCEVAALALQVARTLAAIADKVGLSRVEQHHSFGAHAPVLDEAESEALNAVCRSGCRAAQKCGSIGKTRAVHMKTQTSRLRKFT